jgi:beta-ketoacyl-acyl-carrier-protein synthase II
MTNNRTRVVVTGLGAITALGKSVEETWQNMIAGRSGVRLGQSFDATDYPIKIASEVDGFQAEKYMNFKDSRRMARFSQFAVAAAREALARSGLIKEGQTEESIIDSADASRVGVITGTAVGGFVEVRNSTQTLLEKSYRRVSPLFIPRMMHNAAAANISHQFGLKGFNSTTSTACAAGAQAVGLATEIIRSGRADIMVSGGTEAPICDVGLSGFWATRAMTTSHTDSPEKASRPFDLNRDGLVIGEGAAFLVLERLEHALARSAPIFAEVLGYGCAGDAYHLTAPDSEGGGEARAMTWALQDGDVSSEDIDYISAHGTSTTIGDAIETLAIKRVFGETAYGIPVSAAKSMLGHAIAASGAIEAMACILSIRDRIIHPTINYETLDPECDLDYVPNIAREEEVDLALNNSFGMGGQNTALLFGRI